MQGEMSVVPAGGNWSFTQMLPGNGVRIFSENTRDKLFKVVEQFRINNNLPTHSLADELARGVSAPVVPQYNDERSLRERVTSWLANKQFGVIRYVTPEEANERAKLASECPYNIVNYADACISCFTSTVRGLFALKQGRTTPYDSRLGACRNCGWPNDVVVHLQPSSLQLDGKPKPCWCSMLDNSTDSKLE